MKSLLDEEAFLRVQGQRVTKRKASAGFKIYATEAVEPIRRKSSSYRSTKKKIPAKSGVRAEVCLGRKTDELGEKGRQAEKRAPAWKIALKGGVNGKNDAPTEGEKVFASPISIAKEGGNQANKDRGLPSLTMKQHKLCG